MSTFHFDFFFYIKSTFIKYLHSVMQSIFRACPGKALLVSEYSFCVMLHFFPTIYMETFSTLKVMWDR